MNEPILIFKKQFENKEVNIFKLENTISKILEKLENDKYALSSINTYKYVFYRYLSFCKENAQNKYLFSNILANDFLLQEYNFKQKCDYKIKIIRSLKMLADFYFFGYFKLHYQQTIYDLLNNENTKLIDDYFESIKDDNLSFNTLRGRKNTISTFLKYTENNNISSISNISNTQVTKYINSLNVASQTKVFIIKILRAFFNYTYHNNITVFSGWDVFPIIRKNSRDRLLSFYTEDEVNKILSVIDINTKFGKRDYLIFLLSATLGMRLSDITNLRLKDINWKKQTLEYIQFKTKNSIQQPFSNEVKYALIDYIKNVRHESNDDFVLISERAPYSRYKTNFRELTDKYFKLANIDINGRKHGLHSFRHSLANNMLNNNISMQDISATLGHSTITTTQLYTNIDTSTLKQLALEVPNE